MLPKLLFKFGEFLHCYFFFLVEDLAYAFYFFDLLVGGNGLVCGKPKKILAEKGDASLLRRKGEDK